MNISKVKEILNKKNISFVILIIFFSFAIGLIYNALQPEPLSLIYKKKVLNKIDDKILFEKPMPEIRSGESTAKRVKEKSKEDTLTKDNSKTTQEINKDNKSESAGEEIASNNSISNSTVAVTSRKA